MNHKCMEYNAAFFRTHEAYFLEIKKRHGEDAALAVMRSVMERNLGKAYDSMGFAKGSATDFARVISERDESVGLRVSFHAVTEDKIIYQFHDDPFPGL